MTGTTKSQLISSAAYLLDKGGHAGVTLRAVAERVGVSHNTPYRHFRDRSALLGAVAEQDFSRLKQAFEQANAANDAAGAVRQAAAALIGYARRHPARYRLLFSDPGLPPDPELRSAAFACFEAFCSIVSRCSTDGIMPQRNAVELTGLIYAAIHGAIDLELGGRASGAKGLGDIDATVDLLFSVLRPGC